jgi:hypothetical protein
LWKKKNDGYTDEMIGVAHSYNISTNNKTMREKNKRNHLARLFFVKARINEFVF